jgi:hypothetical protein
MMGLTLKDAAKILGVGYGTLARYYEAVLELRGGRSRSGIYAKTLSNSNLV